MIGHFSGTVTYITLHGGKDAERRYAEGVMPVSLKNFEHAHSTSL